MSMRFALLILLSFCLSSCVAKRFLQNEDEGLQIPFEEMFLQNVPQDYLATLAYVQNSFNAECNLNSDVTVTGVEKVFVQAVAGKNYQIVLKVSNHESEQLTINVFQSIPNKSGEISYKINSCN